VSPSLSLYVDYQAALDYLESIIVNPYEKQLGKEEEEDGQFADAEGSETLKSSVKESTS
jgi:hypothetical protein